MRPESNLYRSNLYGSKQLTISNGMDRGDRIGCMILNPEENKPLFYWNCLSP